MKNEKWLAKSVIGECTIHEKVDGHNIDVGDVSKILLSKISKNIISIFGSTPEIRSINKVCPLSAYSHDIGKCNTHFLDMLRGNRKSQALRHEVCSAIFLLDGNIKILLESDFEKFLMLFSILSHHFKFGLETKPYGLREPGLEETPIELNFDNDQIRQLWFKICGEIGKPYAGNFNINTWDRDAADLKLMELKRICKQGEKIFDTIEKKQSLFLCKSFLVNSDVFASAFFGQTKEAFKAPSILNHLFSVSLHEEDIENIIQKNMPKGAELRGFQKKMSVSKANTMLVQASCGSGKTVGAYGYVKSILKKGIQTRCMYLLSTTTTTTEHHKQHGLNTVQYADLDHSRAILDIEEFENHKISTSDQQLPIALQITPETQDVNDLADKIDVISRLRSPLVTGTCDLVLGAVAGTRRSIYMLPYILQSVIVFDEIHSYDEQMFGHLMMFLKYFPNVPVLLMSATLQKERIEAIKLTRPQVELIEGDPSFSKILRHTFSKKFDATSNIVDAGRQGKKVLYVRNRVNWAISSYLELKEIFGGSIILLHSRFKYPDKIKKQRQAIDGFKKNKSQLVVATQVVEMALDISCDLLVTDYAPPDSLIQRIGRNARYIKDGDELGRVIFQPVEKENHLPYTKEKMAEGERWVESLIGQRISQDLMQKILEEITTPKNINFEEYEENALGINSSWDCTAGLVRSSSTTFRVVMEQDLSQCNSLDSRDEPTSKWLIENEINMPIQKKINFREWKMVKGRIVVPEGKMQYSEEIGGLWK